jgi:hypothetical protein
MSEISDKHFLFCLSISEISILSIKNRCTKHGNKYEFYCSIHGDPCCAMCTRDDHRNCQELRPILEVIF